MILALGCFFVPIPTVEFCRPAIQTGIIANIGALGIIQAILVLRVWYLFSNSRPIRLTMLIAFMISFILSLAFAIVSAADLEVLGSPPGVRVAVGCQAARPDHFWRMFFPSLVLHTLLYILTAIKALRNRQVLKDAPVLKRLLRDGGFFFFVVFVSVGFTSIGSFLTAYPRINIPIAFSPYLISITSIAVSRVMFSIHSLAENLGSDTAWLLNNAELSRVGWRQGSNKGEIIIERWSDEYDDGLRVTDAEAQRASPIKMTRIGTLDNLPWKTKMIA